MVRPQKLLVGFLLFVCLLGFFSFVLKNQNELYSNGAYVTFLSDDNYVIGARVLLQSLKDSGSAYPFLVLVTQDVSENSKTLLRRDA